MKTGILTFTDTANYGAVLQAYALNEKIRQMGYSCQILRYHCDNISKRETPGSFLQAAGLKKKIVWLLTVPGKQKKIRDLRQFLARNASLSEASYDRETIGRANEEYDKFIAGSDIIWETTVTGRDYAFYLDFVTDDEKKFAYAASFGYDRIPDEETETCKALLSSFARISVREQQGQQIIADLLPEKKTELVCDPTLLLPPEHWESLSDGPIRQKKEDYIFLYFPDPHGALLEKARELAKQYGKKIVMYTDSVKPIPGVIRVRNLSVRQFLAYIKNSFFVMTGSYHGVCYSLLFQRNFAFYNRAHGSRILSLVKEMGIEDRNLKTNPHMQIPMDHGALQEKLAAFRKRSEEYLLEILSN